jgi:hypothetical protein
VLRLTSDGGKTPPPPALELDDERTYENRTTLLPNVAAQMDAALTARTLLAPLLLPNDRAFRALS